MGHGNISQPRVTGALGCPELGALVAFLSPKLEKARDTSKVPGAKLREPLDVLTGAKMDSWVILRRGPQKPQLRALPDRQIRKPVVRITLDLLTGVLAQSHTLGLWRKKLLLGMVAQCDQQGPWQPSLVIRRQDEGVQHAIS